MRGAEGQQRSHARRAAVRLPVLAVRRVAHPQPREPSARAVSHDADVALGTRADATNDGVDGVEHRREVRTRERGEPHVACDRDDGDGRERVFELERARHAAIPFRAAEEARDDDDVRGG